ncbi:ribosome biogenesis GTPase [Candidatus Electrothrix aarhusensis]|uniref:Small ribosomal subunit biogenesis GTPase RsgA n=1 Tax=Candidatus Electrothrix aarhusensis TaxID=1859131 RepID=A0A444IT78_9BACT|nr:ribosome biogenesis GTPase [Candidatus Electrothrix aarhusensis]
MAINSLELNILGWNSWFDDQGREYCQPEQQMARVTAVDRGWYTVRNEAGEVAAQVTGKFLHTTKTTSEMPCVGDWVCVHYDAKDAASIHGVLPRKSFLRRKTTGKDTQLQMIAANIDVAFIVQSCQYDFNVPRLERYLVMVSEGQVKPVLVLSKTDLITAAELAQYIEEIRSAGINARIIALSNVTGAGLEEIRELMISGKTYCLLGSSGVGKSTLINQLTGQDILKTGRVSASGEGRHTTVRRQLIVLEQGGMIIDTPGMREVGVVAAKKSMEDTFDDIEELSNNCRFNNCSHSNEPGCAVLQAIQAGTLPSARYKNYVKLKQETKLHARSRKKRP